MEPAKKKRRRFEDRLKLEVVKYCILDCESNASLACRNATFKQISRLRAFWQAYYSQPTIVPISESGGPGVEITTETRSFLGICYMSLTKQVTACRRLAMACLPESFNTLRLLSEEL